MNTTRIRFAIATMATALTITAGASSVATNSAFAAAPKSVHVGSSGNAKLDDICRQMGDLINDEIREGYNAEANGDYGGANAWFNQASDHIRRAQEVGCVMAIKVPPHVNHLTGVLTGTAVLTPATGPTPGTTARKKISGRAGGTGKNAFSDTTCSSIAGWVNYALDQADKAAEAGDPDLAQGWRDHANDLLAAGRKGGCGFTAALRAGQVKLTQAGATLKK